MRPRFACQPTDPPRPLTPLSSTATSRLPSVAHQKPGVVRPWRRGPTYAESICGARSDFLSSSVTGRTLKRTRSALLRRSSSKVVSARSPCAESRKKPTDVTQREGSAQVHELPLEAELAHDAASRLVDGDAALVGRGREDLGVGTEAGQDERSSTPGRSGELDFSSMAKRCGDAEGRRCLDFEERTPPRRWGTPGIPRTSPTRSGLAEPSSKTIGSGTSGACWNVTGSCALRCLGGAIGR